MEQDIENEIWLADDSPVYRTLIAQELRHTTHLQVRCFNDGDALVHAYQKNPLLIILDFHFDFDDHSKNGSKTLQELRQIGCTSPVVLVTGVSDPDFVEERRKENFVDVLDKFEEDLTGRLTEIVNQILTQKNG